MGPSLIPQVRASALQNYTTVARFVGLDPDKFLQSSKLDPSDTTELETKIAASAVVKLLEDSAAASGREDFGLLMAETRSFSALGPISLLLRYQPTLRSVIMQVIANTRLLNDVTVPLLEDDGRSAMIRLEMRTGFIQRQSIELAVAIAARAYGELMAGTWHPETIHFRHRAPKDLKTHKRVFRCPIEFNSDFDGIVCSSASLDLPNPWAEPAMAAHAQRFIDMLQHGQPSSSVTEQARQAIILLLGNGSATMEKVAENLDVHPRTLQRLLGREGASFGALLTEARRDLALRYLNSTQSVTEIAILLGYSSVSSFTRWFTEEFGKSPAAWRKASPDEVVAALTANAA